MFESNGIPTTHLFEEKKIPLHGVALCSFWLEQVLYIGARRTFFVFLSRFYFLTDKHKTWTQMKPTVDVNWH